jgi:asparagine synthase (glutamine-hydrolysing)
MCGIAGIYSHAAQAPPVDRAELERIRDAMTHRGPDGCGLWISADARAGLAHRRLAIIDPGGSGAQPMSTQDGRLWITYNGEIYNYAELRAGLLARGHVLRSASDTEVLLYLYLEHGPAMLERLRGMYAFAIWDERTRSMFMARDPFGIKPLYYSDDGATLRFASQVKALLAGGVSDAPDAAGHAGFFLWGAVPEPFTTCEAIRALPAGSSLHLAAGGRSVLSCHFSVAAEIAAAEQAPPPPKHVREAIGEAVRDSVSHHLVSDVPVGLFLSSGIDSASIAAFAAERTETPLRSVTLGFSEYVGTPSDETPLAARVASACAMRHETHWVSRSEFTAAIPHLLARMDQPSIDGVNTYFASRAAARAGLKVALSGLGGDELFGTYPSYRQIPRLSRWLSPMRPLPAAGRWLRRVGAPLIAPLTSPKYAGVLEYGSTVAGAYLLRRGIFMPWELGTLMDPGFAQEGLRRLGTMERLEESIRGIRSARLQVMALEMQWYLRNQLLRDADWAGMAHSVEIRTPLVDVALFRELLPVLAANPRTPKSEMARSARVALPAPLFARRRSGFTVPVAEWRRRLPVRTSRERGLRGWARIVNGSAPRSHRILALLTDAYGGSGGIAGFNRDMLAAICSSPRVREVIVLPRLAPGAPGQTPRKVKFLTAGLGGKSNYLRALLALLAGGTSARMVLCGHVNLLPAAAVAGAWLRAPVVLVIHGIDAWTPPNSRLARRLAARVDHVVAVSELTRDRFLAWNERRPAVTVVPNAVQLEDFGAGPRPGYLLDRYRLHGRRILLTLGRLAGHERYKGFDEVIAVLPRLRNEHPDIAYVIAGDGSDRARLESLAATHGVADIVTFAGRISEHEKADHYRMADAYAMPSRGEGFGRVLLEALACGIPVVASKIDGGREALLHGQLGELVDPDDPQDVLRGIRAAFARGRNGVPAGLTHFGMRENAARWRDLLAELLD